MRNEKSGKSRATAAIVMLSIASVMGCRGIAGAETVCASHDRGDIPRTLGQPDQGLRQTASPA